MRDLASLIAADVSGEDDLALLDPILVMWIIKILVELIPVVLDQCQNEDEEAHAAINRICSRPGLRGRVIRWRAASIIRRVMGEDAEPGLIRDLAQSIIERGSDISRPMAEQAINYMNIKRIID